MQLICRRFHFDAAHKLPNYNGLCANLHGHRWFLEVEVAGNIDTHSGMIMDFGVLKNVVNFMVIDVLDHKYLNDVFENPTAENMIVWIVEQLKIGLRTYIPKLHRVRLYETPDSYTEWSCK